MTLGEWKKMNALAKKCHAEIGARKAKKILEKLKFKKGFIAMVCHCIACHRFRKGKNPETIEAKCIYDADKIDSLGAIGIGRLFYFACEQNAVIHNPKVDLKKHEAYGENDCAYREFLFKLKKIKKRMLTKTGRKIAIKRHKLMAEFFNQLNKEFAGKA